MTPRKSPYRHHGMMKRGVDPLWFALLCLGQVIISLMLWLQLSSVEPILSLGLRSSSNSVSTRITTTTPPPTHLLRHEVNFLVQTYRETVDSFVAQQTTSWGRHYTSLERDERTDAERKRQLQKGPSPDLAFLHEKIVERSKYRKKTELIQTRDDSEDGIIWDREEDIVLYLDRLIRNCAAVATTTPSFDQDCWDFLHHLVTQPRCTVRLDSRFACDGSPQTMQPKLSAQDLIQAHFQPDTLNVVIVGAGPVGLHLAHGLASIALTRDGAERHIRVLVLEHRIRESGHKQPYSRNWITDLQAEYFEMVDPLVRQFLHLVHYTGKVRLSIRSLETLLLMSARSHGVKFLFESDQNYEQLLSQVPNLLVFDASGHRLDALDIGKNDASVQPLPLSTLNDHYMARSRYRSLMAADSLVHIAEEKTAGGVLLYPVTSSGRPYRAHMLKVNDFDYTLEHITALRDERYTSMASTTTEYCRDPASPCPDRDYSTCRLWCSRLFVWSAAEFYREDIAQRMQAAAPKNLVLTALFASLSVQQADALSHLLPRGSNFLLKDLPLLELAEHGTLGQDGWGNLWQLFATMPELGKAQVNLFTYQPYLYKDPLVPGGWGKKNPAPLLRVGDSLASGDPNLSTGLGFNIQVVQEFILRLEEALLLEPGEQ